MKFPSRRSGSLLIAASAVWLAMPAGPGDRGAFDPSAAMHFDAPVLVGTYAFDVERVFGTQTQMIRRKATKYQREVAEANARAYMAAHLRTQGGAPSSKSGKADGTSAKTKSKTEPQSTRAAKANLPHYIAVDTVKDERSAPWTKKEVMIFDTRSGSLVDNNVYDVSNPPALGATETFDTRPAEYIGNGLLLPEIGQGPKR